MQCIRSPYLSNDQSMTLKKEKQSNHRSDLGHNANEWGKPTKIAKRTRFIEAYQIVD
jgi:hypothetical protein